MENYENIARQELFTWQKKMLRRPALFNNLSKKIQVKLNSYIPEKVHNAITVTLKQMIRGVLFGAKITTGTSLPILICKCRKWLFRKK